MKEFACINGITICFDDTKGNGRPLFLYHGLTRNKEAMYFFRDRLKKDFRVITVDTRGHGESSRCPSYTLFDHADDVIALADHLGLEKISILGFSMGTYISILAMEKYPGRFEKGILVCPKPSGSGSSTDRILKEKGLDIRTVTPDELKNATREYQYAPSAIKKIISGEFTEPDNDSLGIQLTAEEKEAEAASLSHFDLSGDLFKITADVLVIAGEYDGINTKEEAREVSEGISGSRYMLVKDAGHMLPYEKPDEVFTSITGFLKESV